MLIGHLRGRTKEQAGAQHASTPLQSNTTVLVKVITLEADRW